MIFKNLFPILILTILCLISAKASPIFDGDSTNEFNYTITATVRTFFNKEDSKNAYIQLTAWCNKKYYQTTFDPFTPGNSFFTDDFNIIKQVNWEGCELQELEYFNVMLLKFERTREINDSMRPNPGFGLTQIEVFSEKNQTQLTFQYAKVTVPNLVKGTQLIYYPRKPQNFNLKVEFKDENKLNFTIRILINAKLNKLFELIHMTDFQTGTSIDGWQMFSQNFSADVELKYINQIEIFFQNKDPLYEADPALFPSIRSFTIETIPTDGQTNKILVKKFLDEETKLTIHSLILKKLS